MGSMDTMMPLVSGLQAPMAVFSHLKAENGVKDQSLEAI